MLKIQSHEGKIKAEMRGTTQEICAEVAAVIYEITKQTTRPYEGTAQKLIVLKMFRAAINYAIEEAKEEVTKDDQKT